MSQPNNGSVSDLNDFSNPSNTSNSSVRHSSLRPPDTAPPAISRTSTSESRSCQIAQPDAIYNAYPLEEHLEQTRLIKLKPGEWNDRLECELEVVGLGERVDFEAVSYVWGQDFSNELVYVDGYPHQVTTNLLSALRHLRQKSEI